MAVCIYCVLSQRRKTFLTEPHTFLEYSQTQNAPARVFSRFITANFNFTFSFRPETGNSQEVRVDPCHAKLSVVATVAIACTYRFTTDLVLDSGSSSKATIERNIEL